MGKIVYDDGFIVETIDFISFQLTYHNKKFYLGADAADNPTFTNETGENVIEYTGLAKDNNKERSWAKAHYQPGGYSQPHFHKDRVENYYILIGQALVIIDGKEHFLSAGDHITIRINSIHQVKNASDNAELGLLVRCEPSWIVNDFHLANMPKKREKTIQDELTLDNNEEKQSFRLKF